jgi:hypothetical protein
MLVGSASSESSEVASSVFIGSAIWLLFIESCTRGRMDVSHCLFPSMPQATYHVTRASYHVPRASQRGQIRHVRIRWETCYEVNDFSD